MSRSLRNIVAVGGILVLAGCSTVCPGPGPGPGNDNDRPPIIVSDGSVHMRVVAKDRGKGTNKLRGEWKKDGSNWFADHTVGLKPKYLVVTVLNGIQGSAECTNPEAEFEVTELKITYWNGTDETTATPFDIYKEDPKTKNEGRLMTNANATKDPNIPFWLTVGSPTDHLKKVAFPPFDGTGKWCGLSPASQVHIYQSTK